MQKCNEQEWSSYFLSLPIKFECLTRHAIDHQARLDTRKTITMRDATSF